MVFEGCNVTDSFLLAVDHKLWKLSSKKKSVLLKGLGDLPFIQHHHYLLQQANIKEVDLLRNVALDIFVRCCKRTQPRNFIHPQSSAMHVHHTAHCHQPIWISRWKMKKTHLHIPPQREKLVLKSPLEKYWSPFRCSKDFL